MPGYFVYLIGSDGHFYSSIPLDCADDTEAMNQAKQLVDGFDIELWHRDRKVATFPKKPKTKL